MENNYVNLKYDFILLVESLLYANAILVMFFFM
jgi:hypothetical protein